MTADDLYTLPEKDECHGTLEAYKRYLTPYIDDYWQVTKYKAYLMEMEKWQQCCPGSKNSSVRFRPDKTPVGSLYDIRLPSLFSVDAPCVGIFDKKSSYKAIAHEWFYSYSSERASFWDNQYSGINKNLYACCMMRFNRCLELADRQQGSEGVLTNAASARCLVAFSPEYQQQAAAEHTAAQEKQESETVPAGREGKEPAACAVELSRVRQEHSQCKTQAELTAQQDKSEITRLTDEVTEAHKQIIEAHNESALSAERLQGVLTETTPHPGTDVLAGFPTGSGSAGFVVLGIVVLTAGFFLGWPGRSRQSRLNAGSLSSGIALGIFLLSVALLPDTRPVDLLFAVTITVLTVSLRALARILLELRQSGQAPPASSP